MRLKFSLARTGRDIVDLAATVDATVTVGDLAAALDRCDPEREHRRTPALPDVNGGSSRLSLRVHNGTAASGPSTVLSAGLPLSVSGLRSGSLVSIAAVSERFKTPGADRGSAAATLSVLSGPDVGKEFPLAEGIDEMRRGIPYGFSHGAWEKPNPALSGFADGIAAAIRWSHYQLAGGGGVWMQAPK